MFRAWTLLAIAAAACTISSVPAFGSAASATAPASIDSVLKPRALRGVLEEREVVTSAVLADSRYAFHVGFLVHAQLARTVRMLTDFPAYKGIVPYIDRADYDQVSHILKLQGGIWKFVVITEIRFTQKSDRWLGFEMVGGHFKGMTGEMIFEPRGEKGTLVLVRGGQVAREFPPKFLLEQGAPIVFGVTGRRMRSYVESESSPEPSAEPSRGAAPHDNQVPRPRRRLEVP